MSDDITVRLTTLVLVGLLTLSLVWAGRHFVERRQRRALNAPPMRSDGLVNVGDSVAVVEDEDEDTLALSRARVRILAFSSEDCRQCHILQAPVLRRVVEARGEDVSVISIDAPSSPELTERYQVLTVPTTVLLDTRGKAHAVNYGFTNAQSLLKQIDDILAHDEYAEIV